MKTFKLFFVMLFVLACLQPLSAGAKGRLVNIESLSSGNFNPWAGEKNSLTFSILGDTTVNVTIRVFSRTGVMVREKRLKDLRGGKRYKFTWNGRDGKGKRVSPGFYRYGLIVSTLDKRTTDRDQAAVEVRRGKKADLTIEELPPALYSIEGVSTGPAFSMDVSGHVRSGTGINTDGIRWNREEIYLQMKGDYGSAWVYNLTFFPAYTMNQTFVWNNLLYNALIGYRTFWGEIDLGYRNYLEGYNDPLNLLADYQMGSDRISLSGRVSLIHGLDISGGLHRLTDLDEVAMDFRATYEILNGLTAGGCLVNKVAAVNENNNTVFGGDVCIDLDRLGLVRGTNVTVQFAGSSTRQNTSAANVVASNDGAFRVEASHNLFVLPPEYGNLGLSVAWEYVGTNFAADYADLPNGVDNTGIELGADYDKHFGFSWLRSMRSSTKLSILGNIKGPSVTIFQYTGPPVVRETTRFRQNLSLAMTRALNFILQYESESRNDKAPPPPSTRFTTNTFVELRYRNPAGKGWDTSIRYTATNDTVAGMSFDYTSTRLVCGYNITKNLFPYAGYEKVIRFYGPGISTNRDYNYWTLGTRWTLLPATKTQLHLQAGLVTHTYLPPSSSAVTYYAKMQHYFFDAFSFLASYGSLTSSIPVPQLYVELKYEFK